MIEDNNVREFDRYQYVKTGLCGRVVDVHWAPNSYKTLELIDKGCIPIEMAQGSRSYVDFRQLDHHNNLSDNPAASIMALPYYGDCKMYGSFIVNHVDIDCVTTGAILLGLIPQDKVEEFAKTVAIADTDPFNPIMTTDQMSDMVKKIKLWNYSSIISGYASPWSWIHGVNILADLFEYPDRWEQMIGPMERKNARRKIIAMEDYCNRVEFDDKRAILITPSRAWGFDVQFGHFDGKSSNDPDGWRHHVVMSHVNSNGKITIACPNKTIAERTFGKGGLMNVYNKLEQFKPVGWGGSKTIGGSARHLPLSIEEARECFDYLVHEVMAG
jgi:hypothetical protein|nr:MAG TPA: hypothetical protein [Caudoviricetes sp.]